MDTRQSVDPLLDSDLPTIPPPGYQPPSPLTPTKTSERGFVAETVNPFLSGLRDWVSDTVKEALPILQPPAVRAGQGPLGGGLLSGAVDMLNPLPANASDLLRDVAVLAIPGGSGLASAARVAAGTGGAALGAKLADEPMLPAAGASVPGLILGEGVRQMTKNIGRRERQQTQDVKDVSAAMNRTLRGQSIPDDVPGMYQSAYAPRGLNGIREQATQKFQAELSRVESQIDPGGIRPLVPLPDREGGLATFREAMDYIRNETPTRPQSGDLSKSARTSIHNKIKVRDAIIQKLEASPYPRDAGMAEIVRNSSADYFKNMTVYRLLRSPGVLNSETGELYMKALQDAFRKELAKGMVPADVSADLQVSIWRGAKPPLTDQPGVASGIKRGLFGLGGAAAGGVAGHPILGYHAGISAAGRGVADQFVGRTVGPSIQSRILGPAVSIGTAQSLSDLLEEMQ